ncbi:MAG TPA: sigma-54 dependent transcriptional regulator, partial [Acidobacteriota bacterium]|nr:sigma-54 dependent transcriptional regulator [Acidobacteriota bacterium]
MPKPKVLVIDDEQGIQETLKMILEYEGYRYFSALTGEEGIREIEEEHPDVILLDIKMPHMDGGEVFDLLRKKGMLSPVIMISGHANISTAVDFIKRGAFDFMEKPLEREKLLVVVRNAIDRKRLAEDYRDLKLQFEEKFQMIGESDAMKRLREAIGKAAPSNSTVLIRGESGTGKELIARAIYKNSSRADKPFVKVNCAAIPEELIESELFGHEKGSFTGAVEKKIGKFEQADGGTIFLDEIGDMSHRTQAKVLRVLEQGELEKVGGSRMVVVNVRVIAATNKRLEEEIEGGRFRADLFFRLNVIPIQVPPLRERREDIPLLVSHFAEIYSRENNFPVKTFALDVLRFFQDLPWNGNIRELKNVVERLFLMSPGTEIGMSDVNTYLPGGAIDTKMREAELSLSQLETLKDFKETAEKLFLIEKLKQNNWNIA